MAVTPRQLTGPIWAVRTPNCRLPVTTSIIRIAERDEAAVLSLAYFLTPFTVTKTRMAFLDRAAADKTLVGSYHLPFPGFGHVVREGSAYRWLPADWQWTS